jgi:phosphoglycolate phosphatase
VSTSNGMDRMKTNAQATAPVLIFDFDGTLANTFELVIEAVNSLANEYHFERLSSSQIDYLRGLPAHKVLNVLDVSWYHIPELIIKIQRYMKSRMHTVHLYPGIAETLSMLNAKGFSLGIITSNSRENVEILLEKNNCNHFHFIRSAKHIFGKAKALNKVIKQHGLDKNQVFYIGDEVRDIDAAQQCGIKSIAVSWGFNKKSLLLSSEPDLLVDNMHELQEKLVLLLF